MSIGVVRVQIFLMAVNGGFGEELLARFGTVESRLLDGRMATVPAALRHSGQQRRSSGATEAAIDTNSSLMRFGAAIDQRNRTALRAGQFQFRVGMPRP